jgi:biopolymer transport protein ExbD
MDKKTSIMLGLFVLLLAAVIGTKVALRPAGERVGDRPRPIAAMKAADVDELEVTQNQVTVKLKKTGESWAVTAPVSYPADQASVKSAVEKLESLAFDGVVTDRADKHVDYEVTDDKGVHVVARKGGAVLADFLLGKVASGVTMLRVTGKNDVWRAVGSLKYVFGKEPKSWRDHEVISFKKDEVEKVELRTPAGKIVCKRDAGEAGKPDKWSVAEAPPSLTIEKLDDSIPAGIMSTLMTLRAYDFADGVKPEESGLDNPQATAVVHLKGGAQKTAIVGKAKGDQFYVKTPEREQVYLISKYSVERLTKRPIDFRDKTLVDLKPEQITGLVIDVGGTKTELARSGEEWKPVVPADLLVDSSKVKSLLAGFTALRGTSFADDAQKASLAKPAGTVTLKLKDKGTVTLKFGPLKDQDYPVQKVGSPEVVILKKYTAERFLKKPDDLKKPTVQPTPGGKPAAPVKVTHHGVPGATGKAPIPAPVKAPASAK